MKNVITYASTAVIQVLFSPEKPTMINSQNYYIVKTPEGYCQIINFQDKETPEAEKYWGPFKTETEAIAHRVGLIRAGKCQPR